MAEETALNESRFVLQRIAGNGICTNVDAKEVSKDRNVVVTVMMKKRSKIEGAAALLQGWEAEDAANSMTGRRDQSKKLIIYCISCFQNSHAAANHGPRGESCQDRERSTLPQHSTITDLRRVTKVHTIT